VIPASVQDLRLLAEKRLPRFLFDYIEGGSCSETTVQRNTSDLERIELRQRILRDVSSIELTTSVLGQSSSLPVALGPIGLAGLYARRGEVQAAKAAEDAGVPFILSASSCCSLEEVTAPLRRPPIFQLYMIKDRAFMEAMLERVAAAGVSTLVMTVDLIMHSVRYRDVRSTLTGNQSLAARLKRLLEMLAHPSWAFDVGIRGRPLVLGNFAALMAEGAGLSQFTRWVSRNFDSSLTWDDLAWLKDRWRGRLVLKGILDREDAVRACDAGADAIIVSNHGGRQLDCAPSTISVLGTIAQAVGGQTEVLVDGGIRSGTDILGALALGASGVLLGRAWAYALAARGGAGVTLMLEMLRKELTVAMALTGNTDVKKVGSDSLVQLGRA
jgi:L-lactate dehydrogenase (cytochrome)